MKIDQLQAFNAVYNFLDNYYKKNKSDDLIDLLSGMLFWGDGSTADPAIWYDWEKAIQNKKSLSKQEAFDGMIKFLDIYRSLGESGAITVLINKLDTAKDSDNFSNSLVKDWSSSLKEAVSEPEGTREYLSFGDPMQNIVPIVGFNTIYKLLKNYYEQLQSKDFVCLAENMLFLSDGDTNVDPKVWDYWMKAIDNKRLSTRQEFFYATIQFLESYGAQVASSEAKFIACTLRSAKDSNDLSVPLVRLWDYCLREAINEPMGTIYYK